MKKTPFHRRGWPPQRPWGTDMQPQAAISVVSVNVGLPRVVEWRGGMVSTGIFKEPVAG